MTWRLQKEKSGGVPRRFGLSSNRFNTFLLENLKRTGLYRHNYPGCPSKTENEKVDVDDWALIAKLDSGAKGTIEVSELL